MSSLPEYTREQVAQHNTARDAWIIIRGGVYNITDYLSKHPGGVSIVLNKAGKDGTDSFDAMFHSKKAEAILFTLKIGTCKAETPKAARNKYALNQITEHSSSEEISKPVKKIAVSKPAPSSSTVVKSRDKNKDEITKSPTPRSTPRSEGKERKPMRQKKLTSYKLTSIAWVNHNTNLYRFRVPGKKQINVPPGHHIAIVQMIDGTKIKREYTPVTDKPGYFELAIKTYKTYGISEHLAHIEEGEKVEMMGPFGNWEYKPSVYSRVCMYAAGTGLTPMYQVLTAMSRDLTTKANLIFCNKKVEDIIFKKKLDTWATQNLVNVTYLLSQAPTWTQGPKGRITEDIIKTYTQPNIKDEKEFHLVCGPDGFVNCVKEILQKLKIPEEKIHYF